MIWHGERITMMRFIIIACLTLGFWGPAQAFSNQNCHELTIPVQTQLVGSPDLYRAAGVEAARVFSVKFNGRDPTANKKFVEIAPLHTTALLSDGSVISFIRNLDGDGAITDIRLVQSASCLLPKIDFNDGFQQPQPNEILVADFETLPMEILRLENQGRTGKISRALQIRGMTAANEIVQPLIVTDRPIEGFGVSIQAMHGPTRNLLVIMRGAEDELLIASYLIPAHGWWTRPKL